MAVAIGLEAGPPSVFIGQATHLLSYGIVGPVGPELVGGLLRDSPGVVGCAEEEHHGVGVAQLHTAGLGGIVLTGVGRSPQFAAPSVHESRFDGHVQHLFAPPVVHARMFLQFAPALIGLDVLHGFHGQLAHQHAFAQCLAPVHHQPHGLAVPEQTAVLDRHTGQLEHKVLQPLALLDGEGLGIEHHRVAAHVEATGAPLDGQFAHQHFAGLKADVVDEHRVETGARHELHGRWLVAEELGTEGDAAHGVALELEAAECVGREHPDGSAVARSHPGLYTCPVQRFARLGIHDAPFQDVGAQ